VPTGRIQAATLEKEAAPKHQGGVSGNVEELRNMASSFRVSEL
jgi:hypothetical protein